VAGLGWGEGEGCAPNPEAIPAELAVFFDFDPSSSKNADACDIIIFVTCIQGEVK